MRKRRRPLRLSREEKTDLCLKYYDARIQGKRVRMTRRMRIALRAPSRKERERLYRDPRVGKYMRALDRSIYPRWSRKKKNKK